MNRQIKCVFSDIDGTLLNDEHKLSKENKYAIEALKSSNIDFVFVSARSPQGIRPIIDDFKYPIISFGGAYIQDEYEKELFFKGFKKEEAIDIIRFFEAEKLDCAWNIFTKNNWLVKDKHDARVLNEESIVHTYSSVFKIDNLDEEVAKILCMTDPEHIDYIVKLLQTKFPDLSIYKSSNYLIEIMAKGINKANAIKMYCDVKNIDISKTISFGDNYNDEEMLHTTGLSYIMDNAPNELKRNFQNIAKSNNDSGIYHVLKDLNII